jgi:hypothetical protein
MGELGFSAPRLVRRGYDTGQVNAFVRRIDETLHGGAERPVTARDLVMAKFRRVTPLTRGYACPEVDAFLFDVAPSVIRANSARRSVFAAAAEVFPTAASPTDAVTAAAIPRRQPARNWLGRLVNRTD